jgi:hypothetical protein
MRLDFRNIGKGLEAIAGAKKARDLAQAYAKPEEFMDYTPEQQKQIQGLQTAGGYDVEAVPGAEGQAPTLRYTAKPQGVYYDDMGQPEAPIEIAPQRVQRFGGQTVVGQFDPTQLRGLQTQAAAGVYRRYGDIERADALEARAYEQQRALAQEERAKAAEGRAVTAEGRAAQEFGARQTETGLRINRLTREEGELQRATDFSNFAAENPNLTTAELKDAAFKQFKFTPKQWQEAVNTRLGISKNEQELFVSGVKDKLKGKNLQQLGALYNSDPDFDDKTDLAIVPGKNGAVTLNFIDKATNKITETQTFKNESLATEYLNRQATEPETIGSWMMNLRKAEAAIDKDVAYTEALGRRGTEEKGFTKKVQDAEKFLGRKLTEPEKLQFIGLAAKPRAAAEVRDADVISLSKELVNKPTGLMVDGKPTKHTQQTAITAARQMLEQQTAAEDPVDALIARMKPAAAPATRGATPAGQQLIGLSNALLPPVKAPQPAPTTSQEQLRRLYLGQ